MILTVDFETFYTQQYSLSKITTEEYIRHPDFEVIGVSVKIDDEPAEWFSGTKEEIKRWLAKFDWENSVAVAHNAMFDMAILNWHFGIKPGKIADTLSMARAVHGPGVSVSLANLCKLHDLDDKGTAVHNYIGMRRADFTPEQLAHYGEYCCGDSERTSSLFGIFMQGFPVSELKLIDLTIRMFSEPVLELSGRHLQEHLNGVRARKALLMMAVSATVDDLQSNPKFAELLIAYGVEPPKKISAKTKKETWDFSKQSEAFMALLEHESFSVQALMAARLGVKSTLEETRTERLIGIASRGTLPIPLSYYAAHTGRWGGTDKINLQNLPRKSPLKKAIYAPEGFVFCDSDSSQIEARVLAWLAGQQDLLDAFERGEDVYKQTAARIFGIPESEVTAEQRFLGKLAVLSCGYGTGWRKFQAAMKAHKVVLEDSFAQMVIERYRETYPMIPRLWKSGDSVLQAILNNQTTPFGATGAVSIDGELGIRLPNTMYIKYPNLRNYTDPDTGKSSLVYDTKKFKATITKNIWGGVVVENVAQSLARIIIGEQMLRVGQKYRVVATVHDSIGVIIPKHEESTGKDYVELCMKLRPQWCVDLPLNCEAGTGRSYGEC